MVKEEFQKAEIETGKSLTDAKNVIIKIAETFEFLKNDFNLKKWKNTISGHISQLLKMGNNYKERKYDLDKYDIAIEDVRSITKMTEDDKKIITEIVNKYKSIEQEEFNNIQSEHKNLSTTLSLSYSDIKTRIEELKILIEDFTKFEQHYLSLTK